MRARRVLWSEDMCFHGMTRSNERRARVPSSKNMSFACVLGGVGGSSNTKHVEFPKSCTGEYTNLAKPASKIIPKLSKSHPRKPQRRVSYPRSPAKLRKTEFAGGAPWAKSPKGSQKRSQEPSRRGSQPLPDASKVLPRCILEARTCNT